MSAGKILMMRELNYVLDKSSDRYRECLNCETPFMAQHRQRKFCDNGNWCHDEYNNRMKREEHTKELDEEVPIENIIAYQKDNGDVHEKINHEKKWVPNNKPSPVNDFGSLEQNIEACINLNIPSGKSISLRIEDIDKFGINPDKFSRRVQVISDDDQVRYMLEFGDFGFTFTNFNVASLFWLRDLYSNN
jgi:hypothetical protein